MAHFARTAHDVKGVLSGVGGDEWFAGYPVTRRMARYGTTISGQAQAIRPVRESPVELDSARTAPVAGREPGHAAQRSWPPGYKVTRCFGMPRRGEAGLTNGSSQEARFNSILSQDSADWTNETTVGLSCLLDTRVYMTYQLLRDSDATSMAHSLELRVPFVRRSTRRFFTKLC